MATVTITETGVTLLVSLVRDEAGTDRVLVGAASVTDNVHVPGRVLREYDLTPSLSPAQLTTVKNVLDFIEGKVKAQWNIP